MSVKKISAEWMNSIEGSAKYRLRRAEAQTRANETGFDHGIEANHIFRDFTIVMLPRRENRYGYETRCEIVHPENLATTQPGHGP